MERAEREEVSCLCPDENFVRVVEQAVNHPAHRPID